MMIENRKFVYLLKNEYFMRVLELIAYISYQNVNDSFLSKWKPKYRHYSLWMCAIDSNTFMKPNHFKEIKRLLLC